MTTPNETYTDYESAEGTRRSASLPFSHFLVILDMVEKYPNDADLGENIRKFINNYFNHE